MKKILKLFIFMFIAFITCCFDVKADYTISFDNAENEKQIDGGAFPIGTYYRIDTNNNVCYCYQPYVAYASKTGTYSNCNSVTENAKQLAYIFANGYGSNSNDYATGGDKYDDYYATQLAVWYFGDRTIWDYSLYPSDYFRNFNLTNKTYNGNSSNIFTSTVNLINDAESSVGKSASVSLEVSDTKLSINSDKSYYVSKPITIKGSWVRNNVTLSVSGIDNVFLTKNLNGVSASSNFNVGDTVYVKVPVNSVTSEKQITLKISASSRIEDGTVQVCSFANYQKMVFYNSNPSTVNNTLNLSAVPTSVSVVISKMDVTGSSEVKGATLVIKKGSTEVLKWVSDGTEKKISLDIGEYILEETIAPAGYKLNTEKITFKVNSNGTVTVNDSVVSKIVMKNEPFYVTISKLSLDKDNQLIGATLKITDKEGKMNKDLDGNSLTWVTTNIKKKFHLAAGTYYLSEEKAPDGYIKNDKKIEFTVSSNGIITVDKKTVNEVVLENEPIYVYISKLGIDKDKQLEGVTLKVTDKEGKLDKDLDGKSLTWITTSNKEKFHLGEGTYYLTEEKAPAGYIKSNKKIEFTISKDGVITVSKKEIEEVVMENEPLYIYISKKSINGKTELSGAILKITNKNGNLENDLDGKKLTWTTSTKEEKFRLAPGTYILTEVEAPKGYELSDAVIEFTVTDDGKILYNKQEAENNMIVFKNTPEPEQVQTGSTILYILFVGIITAGVVTFFVYKRKSV